VSEALGTAAFYFTVTRDFPCHWQKLIHMYVLTYAPTV